MATAVVELVYDDESRNRRVDIKKVNTGARMLDTIGRRVEKRFKDDDWIRWNLVEVKDTLV